MCPILSVSYLVYSWVNHDMLTTRAYQFIDCKSISLQAWSRWCLAWARSLISNWAMQKDLTTNTRQWFSPWLRKNAKILTCLQGRCPVARGEQHLWLRLLAYCVILIAFGQKYMFEQSIVRHNIRRFIFSCSMSPSRGDFESLIHRGIFRAKSKDLW